MRKESMFNKREETEKILIKRQSGDFSDWSYLKHSSTASVLSYKAPTQGLMTDCKMAQVMCLRVTVAGVKHPDQSNLGRKGFILLTLPGNSLPQRETREELK